MIYDFVMTYDIIKWYCEMELSHVQVMFNQNCSSDLIIGALIDSLAII